MVLLQNLNNKLGEIQFRQKLVRQHQNQGRFFPTHTNAAENLAIIKKRAQQSWDLFKTLRKQKILLSPFLELGGEKCERAAVLTSKMKAQGAVIDISAESLASAPHFCRQLGFRKLPLRICADAYHLPFTDNSFPFIFTFQTLHHFPDPKPILKEIYRVLMPGGLFYFDEEPIKQTVNIPLWRRDFHLRWWEKILKITLILPFISLIGKSEVSEGVLEETFSLLIWKKALDQFDEVDGELIPFLLGPKTYYQKGVYNWLKAYGLTKIILFFLGGTIKGFCRKKGKLNVKVSNLNDMFACPFCYGNLINKKSHFICLKCNSTYPIKNNVYYLLPDRLLKKLYPAL